MDDELFEDEPPPPDAVAAARETILDELSIALDSKLGGFVLSIADTAHFSRHVKSVAHSIFAACVEIGPLRTAAKQVIWKGVMQTLEYLRSCPRASDQEEHVSKLLIDHFDRLVAKLQAARCVY